MVKKSLLSAFSERLRAYKKLEITVYAVILAAAAVIFMLSGGISSGRGAKRSGLESGQSVSSPSGTELEARLEAILSSISGAGRVRVMVTTDEAGASSDAFGLGTDRASENALPKIIGVIVVAQGAGDIRVKNELQTAVMTVLGTDAASISIFSMNE